MSTEYPIQDKRFKSPNSNHRILNIHLSYPQRSFFPSLFLSQSYSRGITLLTHHILSILLSTRHQRQHNDHPTASFYEINHSDRPTESLYEINKQPHKVWLNALFYSQSSRPCSFHLFHAFLMFIRLYGSSNTTLVVRERSCNSF